MHCLSGASVRQCNSQETVVLQLKHYTIKARVHTAPHVSAGYHFGTRRALSEMCAAACFGFCLDMARFTLFFFLCFIIFECRVILFLIIVFYEMINASADFRRRGGSLKMMNMSDSSGQPIGSPSASASLHSAGFTRGEEGGGRSAKEGSARRGEWMTSGGWRQHVWDWRVRSTQLGRDRTHSWLWPAFLHKTGL